jgi:hypothetical protein
MQHCQNKGKHTDGKSQVKYTTVETIENCMKKKKHGFIKKLLNSSTLSVLQNID